MNRNIKQFAKIVCMCIVAILLIEMIPHSTMTAKAGAKTASKNKAAMKSYAALLASEKRAKKVVGKYLFTNVSSSCEFALIDLNKDGIKEIIMTSDGGYHTDILAYVSGKVKIVGGSYASGGYDKYYPNKHVYYTATIHMGNAIYTYYRFNGKTMKAVAEKCGSDYVNMKTGKPKKSSARLTFAPYKYTVNGKKVSKKKYRSYVKKLLKGSKSQKLKWHENTKANRSRYLLGKVPSVRNLKERKTYAFNLDKKGKKEKITYYMDKNLAINIKINGKVKKKIRKKWWSRDSGVDSPHVQIFDINKKDKYLDIWVYTFGFSEDIIYSGLYRYANQEIKKIWELETENSIIKKMYSRYSGKVVSTNGNGKFTVAMDRALNVDNLIGNHWDKVVFQLKKGKVNRVSRKTFYFYRTFNVTDIKPNPKGKIVALVLSRNTKFYKMHSKSSVTFTVKKGTKCYPQKVYIVSNKKAYVWFKIKNGKSGWLCSSDYSGFMENPFSNVVVAD